MRIRSGPRLFVTGDLGGGRAVDLTAGQTHYLKNVMRLAPGGAVTLFNGRDGEWQGRIDTLGRSAGSAVPEQQTRPQAAEPDLWLLFAPLKRGPLDFLVQKAVELGVSELRPVLTRHTEVGRVNTDRLRAIVLEAAEQCERLTLPQVREPVTLEAALASWPDGRRLLACAEFGPARPIGSVLAEMGAAFAAQSTPATPGSPAALLTGPVGGFTTTELDGLRNLPFVTAVALGPRVLRAETAAIAALACWQSVLGDWRSDRKQTPKAT
jgi:16S rRNA (uracil1498-N3)-methyltransferase